MNIDQLKSVIDKAVFTALTAHREFYEQKLEELLLRDFPNCRLNNRAFDDNNSLERKHFIQINLNKNELEVSNSGMSPSLDSIKEITNFPEPRNLYELTIFVGKISRYKRFIKDFHIYTNPLIEILKANNGNHLDSYEAIQTRICLNVEQLESFNKSRLVLSSGHRTQSHPDYKKPLNLTTYCNSKVPLLSYNSPSILVSNQLNKYCTFLFQHVQIVLVGEGGAHFEKNSITVLKEKYPRLLFSLVDNSRDYNGVALENSYNNHIEHNFFG